MEIQRADIDTHPKHTLGKKFLPAFATKIKIRSHWIKRVQSRVHLPLQKTTGEPSMDTHLNMGC
ncbi:MAG TPA: hypothetical protein DCR17_04590 [Verrucomicrobiales bacterium]|nr:hypothetical protein [Verrucomicrobiales bacterium]HAQ98345.1 hypothetical protein [Verrucomicrobiales bacterium]HAW02313.1 hypothetical protein [Verrucomicrobiales bacterium]HBP54458.1 hypothetical protein [Verrucomicrobiales bacterium]HCP37553.1 hypothetical protein [Verrucomicrobiales bacterium]